jgi:hypothetical protein
MTQPGWQPPGNSVAVTVGASPYQFQSTVPGNITVNAGTVSIIEISRDGTNFFATGLLGGMFFLCPGDFIRVTFIVAPTMTWFPI